MKRFKLNTRDFLRGLLVAVLTPVFVIVQQSIQLGSLSFNWKAIGMAAVGGFLAYLTKNFFTDSVKSAEKTIEKSTLQDQILNNKN